MLAALSLAAGFLAGCASPPPAAGPRTNARFFIESNDGRGVEVTLPRSGVALVVVPKPVISEFDVVNVEIARVELGQCLLFQLTRPATRDLYRLTGSHQGRRLVLAVDDAVVGARPIDGPMVEGELLIFVEIPDEELPALVQRLKSTARQLQMAARKP